MSYKNNGTTATLELNLRPGEGVLALESLLDAVSESAVLIDREGMIVFANKTAAARLGCTQESLTGRELLGFIPPDVGNRRLDHAYEAINTGTAIHFEDTRLGMRFSNSIQPVFDENREVKFLAIFSKDITRIHDNQKEFARLALFNKTLLANAPDLIIMLDKNARVLAINHPIGSHTTSEIIGNGIYQFVRQENRKDAKEVFERVFATGKQEEFVRQVTVSDRVRWLDVRVIPIAPKNEIEAITCIIRDITETKEAQLRLEQKNAALREVIEHIEHEKAAVRTEVAERIDNHVMPLVQKMKLCGSMSVYAEMLEQTLQEFPKPVSQSQSLGNYKLTPRELEICAMIKLGLSTKEIARNSHASPQTVEKQRKAIRKKLGLTEKSANLTSFLKQC